MFGLKAASTLLSPGEHELLKQALSALGLEPPRWKRRGVVFLARGEACEFEPDQIQAMLRSCEGSAALAALALAESLDLSPPADIFSDPKPFTRLLRPRLVHPRELQGPRRAMCRRDAVGELLQAVSIGSSAAAPLVTSSILDTWGAHFEDLCAVAADNLARCVTNKHVLEVQGAPGLLALLHDDEPAASAFFIVDRLFPADLLPHGVVFAVPVPEVFLAFPVIEDAGPDGLASIVQASYSMAHEHESPLSERAFWRRRGDNVELPMTAVQDRKSRRIHIEARGPLEDLLRILGAIE